MGKKIFISYKYADNNVQNLMSSGNIMMDSRYDMVPLVRQNLMFWGNTTVRDYVDEIVDNYLKDSDIYKGEEDDNDLSQCTEETIKKNLKVRLHDSSITIVLISPNMKTRGLENKQWIPWEISYSLKNIERGDKMSRTNGILAVVLPDSFGLYEYFIKHLGCGCCCEYQDNRTFEIIMGNMYNHEDAPSGTCNRDSTKKVNYPIDSYVEMVTWEYFICDPQQYIDNAEGKLRNIKQYDIQEDITREQQR